MARRGQNSFPIVGVMGSGQSADSARCAELGAWLATQRVHLLTGGGGGVMAAVSRGFFEVSPREGLVIGVLRGSGDGGAQPMPGYPNEWVELPIRTHLPLSGTQGTDPMSRNHINMLTADVVIAMAGSSGTQSEVRLAVQYRKPVVAYLQDRADIPQLPEEVPVAGRLEDVQAFVIDALRGAP
ncbi:MAG: molybdenum cofactor carrier protein [Myxococcota bacterium]